MTFSDKPRIVVSKCIEFDFCRYNEQIIRSDVIAELKPFVEFIPICPEMEIGLGVPRQPIRIVKKNDQRFLIQPQKTRDVTKDMITFSKKFLGSLYEIDGFILKSRSPSCGLTQVKIYPPGEKNAPIARGAGFFGEQVKSRFPMAIAEDESRLNNHFIREHFLRTIYIFSRFRKLLKTLKMRDLVDFHTRNKFLLMAYNQTRYRELGRIVANHDNKSVDVVFQEYSESLQRAFLKAPRCSSNINVLLHIFGFFSKDLKSEEKKFFLDLIEKYRNGQVSLASITNLLKSWVLRFNQEYLINQTYFEPYPSELQHIENIDSCKVRDFWK